MHVCKVATGVHVHVPFWTCLLQHALLWNQRYLVMEQSHYQMSDWKQWKIDQRFSCTLDELYRAKGIGL